MRTRRLIDDPDHDIMGSYPHDISYVTSDPIDMDGLYLRVHRAGITIQTPRDFHIDRDESYMYCVIHCVFRGKGTVNVRGRSYEIKRGQLFILASNEPHTYYSDAEDPLGLVWVEFAGGNSAQLLKHILDLGGPVYGEGIFTELTDLCTAILYHPALKNQPPKISSMLYEMLMRLCAHVESEGTYGPVEQHILKYIDDNISRRLSLAEISASFGYHPAYFSSRFAKNMGVTFSKYVMQRKMNHACHLLETTTWSVDHIAHELGFCDISHFIQRFKTSQGMTPRAYRQRSNKKRLEGSSQTQSKT